jgi:hypothetical protein
MLLGSHSVMANDNKKDSNDDMTADISSFQCGNSTNATVIPVSTNFSSIRIGALCDGGHCDSFLSPKEIYWHIYPFPTADSSSTTPPKHAMYPEGLLQAQVRDGVLSYQLQNILEEPLGYHQGQPLQAGISLYIPTSLMSIISIEGIEQYVQVHADQDEEMWAVVTEPLRIVNQAIDSQVLVSSPYWAVHYEDSGIDNSAWMDVAANSSVDVSGVNIQTYLKCPEGLTVRGRGVDNDIFVQGPVQSATLDGIDAELQINNNNNNNNDSNPCANVTIIGVWNECEDSNDVLEMQDLTCLADTEAGYQCNWSWNVSTAGSIVMGVSVVLVMVAAVAGCIVCCVKGCCCRNSCNTSKHVDTSNALPPYPPAPTFPAKVIPNETSDDDTAPHSVVEAEVLEVKSTTAEHGQWEDIDLEKQKDTSATPQVY